MSIITDFLKLFKYDPETDGASTFNIKQCLNDNWDKIDAWASGIKTTIAGLVPGTRKVNGKELSADVTLTGEDIKTSASDETTISSQLSNKLSVTDHGSNSTSLLDTSLSEGIHICSNWTDCPPGLTDAQGTCISTTFLRFADPVKYWGYRIYLPINDQKIYINRCANSVWDGWEAIATATPPQEFDLPLAEGLSAVSSAYWKDQFGVVTGHFNVLASSPQTGSSPVIATLPEGFRPSRQANATAVVSSGESLGLLVRQTGEIQLQDAASVTLEGKYIKGLFSFVAAS